MSAHDVRSRARFGIAIVRAIGTTRSDEREDRGWKLVYVAQKRTGSSILNIFDAITHTRAVSSHRMRRRRAAAPQLVLFVRAASVGVAARLVAPYILFWHPIF